MSWSGKGGEVLQGLASLGEGACRFGERFDVGFAVNQRVIDQARALESFNELETRTLVDDVPGRFVSRIKADPTRRNTIECVGGCGESARC